VLPAMPSNEKDSSDHHNSYNKGPNLAFFSFTESPSNSIPIIKFPKNHITFSYHSNMGCLQGTVQCLEPCSECTKCSVFKKKCKIMSGKQHQ
jgi:hypothetical protein